eukprot:3305794-Rhodomonas_salina.1
MKQQIIADQAAGAAAAADPTEAHSCFDGPSQDSAFTCSWTLDGADPDAPAVVTTVPGVVSKRWAAVSLDQAWGTREGPRTPMCGRGVRQRVCRGRRRVNT